MKQSLDLPRLGVTAARAILMGALVWAAAQNAQGALTHRYSFNDAVGSTTAKDSIGGADGMVMNGASISNGVAHFSNTIASGSGCDYIDLGTGLINGYTTVTFEFWCTVGANGPDRTEVASSRASMAAQIAGVADPANSAFSL